MLRRLALPLLACGLATAEPPERTLAPGDAFGAALAPGETQDFTIGLPTATALDLRIEQADASLQLEASRFNGGASGEEPIVLRNDAGRGAVLALTLTAPQATAWRLRLSARHPERPADYRLTAGSALPLDPAAQERARAQALLAQADALRREQDGDAAALFEAAAKHAGRSGDPCLERAIRTEAGRLAVAAGHFPDALADAQAALALPCAGQPAEQAQAEKLRSMALGYLGRYAAAARAGERALALYRDIGDLRYQGVALGNLAAIYRELGRSGRALDAVREALDLAAHSGDAEGIVFNREGLAAVHLARGELAAALREYRATLDALRTTPYPMIEAQAWNDLGILYRRLGDAPAAEGAFARALALFEREGIATGRAETLLNQADALLRDGAAARAAERYAQALALARAESLDSARGHALRGLGETALALGRPDEALVQLHAARALAQQLDEPGAQAAAELALGARALGQPDGGVATGAAAQAHYRRALALAERAGDAQRQVEARIGLARALRREGDAQAAWAELAPALDLIERERIRIDDPGLRTGFFAGQRAGYDLAIDILMALHEAAPDRGYAALALETAERARARSLQDALAERALELDERIDPELRTAERRREDDLRALALRQSRTPSESAAARAALAAAIEAAARALDAARGRIRAADPRHAELLRPARPDLATIQRDLLDPGTTALVYWLGESASWLWVVRRDSLAARRLPPQAEIEADAARLRELLLRPGEPASNLPLDRLAARELRDAERLERERAALAQRWLGPEGIAALRGPDTVVVADGALWRLPFAIFADPAQAPPAIAYLPSFGALRGLRALPPRSGGNAIAIVADPVFRPDDERLPSGTAPPAAIARSLAPLPQARAEAMAIAALAGPRLRWFAHDFTASREAALAAPWADYAIAHFATHALLDARRPELSGIVLSMYGADGTPRDGFLRATDLYRLDLPADLAVLSACDSASGAEIGGEGVLSLARAFFHAGTRRVVASLWPVDDEAGAALMRDFYAALLREGASPRQALARAQTAMRARPRHAAPFYWAGFVLQGDYR